MKLQAALLLALFALIRTEEITEDEGVLVLTNGNFDKATADNKFILVEFCELISGLTPVRVSAFIFTLVFQTLNSFAFCVH